MNQYIVDAFTDKVFAGNPAAVCQLETWPDDSLLQSIAIENNLSETAFIVKKANGVYHLRWFTPGGEIDLCGHATLASAYVVTSFIEPGCTRVDFETMSGVLTVTKEGSLFAMDFPAYELQKVEVTDAMEKALGARPQEAYLARDLVCVFDNEETVRSMQPDFTKMLELDGLLVNVTAPGKDFDCVSRSFAPKLNVAEDPVCGSGHCHILPYWQAKTGKNELIAYQASRRGGVIYAQLADGRCCLKGKAALFAKAEIFI